MFWNRSLVSLERRGLITTLIVFMYMLVSRGQLDFLQRGSAIRNNDPAHTRCTAHTHPHNCLGKTGDLLRCEIPFRQVLSNWLTPLRN